MAYSHTRQHLESSALKKCLMRWDNTQTERKKAEVLDSLAPSPFVLLQWTWWQEGLSSFRYLISEDKNTESPSCTHTWRANNDHGSIPESCPKQTDMKRI